MKKTTVKSAKMTVVAGVLAVLLSGCAAGTESHIPAMTNDGQNPAGGFKSYAPGGGCPKYAQSLSRVGSIQRDAALSEIASKAAALEAGSGFAGAAEAAVRETDGIVASGKDAVTGSAWGRFADGRLVIVAADGGAASLSIGGKGLEERLVQIRGAAGVGTVVKADGSSQTLYAVSTQTAWDVTRDAELATELDTHAVVYVVTPTGGAVFGVTAAGLGPVCAVSKGGVVMAATVGSDAWVAFGFKKAALDAGAAVFAGWAGAVDQEQAAKVATRLGSTTPGSDWSSVARELEGTGVGLTPNLARRPLGL